MPSRSTPDLVGGTFRRTAARTLLSCRLHPAPPLGSLGLAEQSSGLWLAVSSCSRDPTGDRRRSPAPRREDRLSGGSPYLGSDTPAPSPCPLCSPRGWALPRSAAMDSLRTQVLFARQSTRCRVSRKVPRCA